MDVDVATTFFRRGVRERTKILKKGAWENSFLFSLLRPFLSVEWGEKLADATSRGGRPSSSYPHVKRVLFFAPLSSNLERIGYT